MYAQLVQGGAAPQNREEMDEIVVQELLPALHEEPGFAGALNLIDRETGHALMLMLWESEDQARRPLRDYGQPFLQALASISAISSGQRAPISVWEVNARA